MAPEQAKGSRDLDHRVDLYAVGVILYEALTGQVPFNADTFNELLFKIVLEEPRPLALVDPTIDAGFAAIVTKGMARDPALRFQTAREFQEALEQWGAGRGPELAVAMRLPQQSSSGLNAQAHSAPLPMGSLGSTGTAPRLGTGTPGTWAQTGSALGAEPVAAPKKSNAGLFAALGVLGLAVLGGGSFFAMRGMQAGEAKQAEDASAAAAAAERDKQAAVDAEKAKSAESNAKAEAAAREAADARAEAERVKAEAAAEAEKSKLAAAAASDKAKLAVAPRPAARPAPRPGAPKEPAKPSGTGAGGRKIRTSL
jgi:serine/threonine-protein kinase